MATGEPHAVGTAGELVAPDGSPGLGAKTSLAHGWACGLTVAFTSYALGVRPASPGYRTWTVEPHPGPLRHARGAVPTPHGPLHASWTRTGDTFTLEVTAPPGTTGTLRVHEVGPGSTGRGT